MKDLNGISVQDVKNENANKATYIIKKEPKNSTDIRGIGGHYSLIISSQNKKVDL